MIQSRAQFGSLGALLVVVIAGVMYIGFFASNIVLAGKSLHGVVDTVPVPVGIVIGALGSGIIGIIGYRFIHVLNRIGTWVLGIGIVVGFGYIFSHVQSDDFLTRGSFNISGWLATVSLAALWQIAFAPYVSDYSRYLPADVKVSSTFWTTYLGSALGSSLSFVFGAVAVLAIPAGMDTMDAVKLATGAIGPLMLVLFLLSVISHNALNLYGAVLSIITLVQTFAYRWIPTAKSRAVLSLVVLAACCVVAVFASADFIGHFVDMVLVLLVVLVPWTAINLIDFYVIHKGDYDIQSIFKVDGASTGATTPGIDRLRGGYRSADPIHEHPAVRRPGIRPHRWRRPVVAGGPAGHLATVLVAGDPGQRLPPPANERQTRRWRLSTQRHLTPEDPPWRVFCSS